MNTGLCIVLGGRGFVGSTVVEEARRRGYHARVVDRDEYEKAAGTHCDLLINANGNSKKYLAAQDPALDFDLSVRSVIQSLRDFPAKRYVYLSSIDVYPVKDDPAGNAETARIEPRLLAGYGFHKFLAEELVRFHAKSWLIFRMGGFVGRGLWKNSVYDILKNNPPRVHPDSAYQYLNTADLAAVVFDLLDAEAAGELFNLAGDGVISLREIAAWVPTFRWLDDAESLPRERYEVNVAKLKARHRLPDTVNTVRRFVHDVLAGKEKLP